MNKKLAMAVAMAMLPLGANAQMVPAIDKTALVEAYPADFGQAPVKLDAKELEALKLANEWINSPEKPIRSEDGSVKYVFGATMPALICSLGRVCMIRLEQGESVVGDIQAGDSKRWDVFPVVVGPDGNQTDMITVKAHYANLTTNIVVNTTRRTYMILLKSTKDKWIPEMSFIYPENVDKAWAAYRNKKREVAYASTLSTGERVDKLDFDYRMSGDGPWKPIRVYNNGAQVTIQFAEAGFHKGAPALVALGNDGGLFGDESTEIFNYRPGPDGDSYIVDGLPQKMGLISGVGKGEKKVIIEYVGRKKQ